MGSDERLLFADLSEVRRSLELVHQEIGNTNQGIENLAAETRETQKSLFETHREINTINKLIDDESIRAKARHNVAQFKNEKYRKFGRYDKIRRSSIAILEITDIDFIRHESVKLASEHVYLKASEYWLAAAIVALSAWLRDDATLSQKAVYEAVSRDYSKTSLLFALISIRADRYQSAKKWMECFFSLQNHFELSPEFVQVFNALSTGIFNRKIMDDCSSRMTVWYEACKQNEELHQNEIERWSKVFQAAKKKIPENLYPQLRLLSPTWKEIEISLSDHYIHAQFLNYFQTIYGGMGDGFRNKSRAVDDLIMSLIEGDDRSEAAIQQKIRKNEIIADHGHDWQPIWELEKSAHAQSFEFPALMKDIVLNPAVIKAGHGSRKIAAAFVKDWIIEAQSFEIKRQEKRIPKKVALNVDGWRGSTLEGENEIELIDSLTLYYAALEKDALKKEKIPLKVYLISLLILLASTGYLYISQWQFSYIIAGGYAIGLLNFLKAWSKYRKTRKRITIDFSRRKEKFISLLKELVAEVLDYREDIGRCRQTAVEFVQFMKRLDVLQYFSTEYDRERRVV